MHETWHAVRLFGQENQTYVPVCGLTEQAFHYKQRALHSYVFANYQFRIWRFAFNFFGGASCGTHDIQKICKNHK